MALRPEDLPRDPALLTEFTLALAAKNEALQATVDRLQRLIFGARSERMAVVLAEQLALELGDLAMGTKPVAANDDTAGSAKPESQAARKKPNRNIGALPKDLPRVDVIIEPETTICGCCAGKLHRIGEDESEVLDRIPAVLRVVRTIRPKYVCRSCDDGIVQAPAPPRLIEGGMVSTRLVSHIAAAKYGWYSTLYRQMQIIGGLGVPVDRSTLARWMKHTAWMLKGLYQLQLTQMHSYPRLFCDETPMPVIEPGRPHTKTCQFWTHATDDRPWGGPAPTAVAYVFAQGRGKKEIASQLAGFEGVLQVDGYAAYGSLARDQRTAGKIRLAFCLTHARRKFVDVHKTTNSTFAREVIERLADVYAIEKEIRGTNAANRRAVRQAETKPIMEALHARMVAVSAGLSKISTLHEAIEYTLTHWAGLTMFIDDGRLEPDTNTVERNIRPIAIGRRNSLFCGDAGGGETWAILSTLLQTAKLNGLDPETWLTDVLERIVSGRTKSHQLHELLAWNWKAAREAEAKATPAAA
jgi:transposase